MKYHAPGWGEDSSAAVSVTIEVLRPLEPGPRLKALGLSDCHSRGWQVEHQNHRRGLGDRKKAGEIVEIVLNQKDGRQIAPSRSPLKDLNVYGEVGDLTAVSGGYGRSDSHLPRFFSVSVMWQVINWVCGGVREPGTSDNGAEQRPDAICYRHCERTPERHPRRTHPCRCAASTSCEPAENR
jgi:hypothetical protein